MAILFKCEIHCPDCGTLLRLARRTHPGQRLQCPDCGNVQAIFLDWQERGGQLERSDDQG